MFEEQQLLNGDENITSDEDEPMDFDTISQKLQASKSLDNVYANFVILEGDLSQTNVQAAVSKNYGKIQSAFFNVRNILKKNLLTTKSVY